MSGQVIQIMSHAKSQAARQGCLFVGLEQLVLGLLATPCFTSQHLASRGLSLVAAQQELDAKIVVPVTSTLSTGDVDMAPVARQALSFAQECALAQECRVIGSSHVAAVLLQDRRSPLRAMLEARGANIRALEDEVLDSWAEHPEEAGKVTSMTQQVDQLRQEYQRMSADTNGNRNRPMRGSRNSGAAQAPSAADDDDIYN